jgi:hypothetical protein
LKRSDGTTETCIGFKCSGQRCLDKCTNTADCLPGYVCNSSSSLCEATPASTEDDGGCAMGARSNSSAWLVFAAALVAWSKRRSRCATPRQR